MLFALKLSHIQAVDSNPLFTMNIDFLSEAFIVTYG